MRSGLLPRRLPLILVRYGRRWPRTVLVVALLTWVLAGLLATRVRIDTDLLSLVPKDNEIVSNFSTTVERFGSVDTLLAVVRLDPTKDREPVLAFTDFLAENLRDSDLINWVEYRMEDPAVKAVPLLDRATLFLDPESLDLLLDRLDDEGVKEQAELIRAKLMTPQSLLTKDLIRLDPMSLLPGILTRVKIGGVGLSVDSESGCMIDSGGELLLLLAKPIRPAQDIDFDRQLVAALPEILAASEKLWREEGWEGDVPEVAFTGGYVIAVADTELIVNDAILGLITSLIGVMLIFLLAFRRRAALIYAFVPLMTGLSLTFSFAVLTLGKLNSLTSAFGGLLIGLGIDFIIVLYGRYVEERQAGRSHEEAIDAMGRHTGVGVLLGAVTTGATFYAFLVTDFQGLWELGLVTGTGILLLVAAVFFVLSALLTLLQDRQSSSKRNYLHSFGTEGLCRTSLKYPRFTLVMAALLTLGFGWSALRLEFDDDVRNMRAPDNPGIVVQEEVMQAFGLRFTPMTLRIDGATEFEAMSRARQILPVLEKMVDDGVLASIDTIAEIVPTEQSQRNTISTLIEHEEVLQGLHERFAKALSEVGLNPSPFMEGIDHLKAALSVREPAGLTDLKGTSLEVVVGRYVATYDGGVSTAVFCYPPAGKWLRGAPPELIELTEATPGVVLAGTNVVSAELRRIVWGDAARAAVIGLVLVFILMWADLGSASKAMLGLFPLFVGMVWMLGAMAYFEMQVNLINIFVMTMIIGIGVDYGIHLLHRWQECGGDRESIISTAKAITVAALTTMVGFGSLSMSHYPGLKSVGTAAVLGAGATALLSITVLGVLLDRNRSADD